MTRDEAIDHLSVLAERMDSKDKEISVYDISLEAVEMAIEALEQEPTTVLQEIRQEMESHGIIMQISNGEKIIGENVYIAKEIVLEIIDKHIGDTE